MHTLRTVGLVVVTACLMVASVRADDVDAHKIYLKTCASCHGPDGRGKTPAGRKIHAKDLTVTQLTDAGIEKQILSGSKDEKGNVRMPPFESILKPEEVTALVAYVKALHS